MSDSRESREDVELHRSEEIQTWERALRQLSWRIVKALLVIGVFIGIPLITASYHLGWFSFPDPPQEVRYAFMIGIVDIVLLLVLFQGVRWVLVRRPKYSRVTKRTDT